MIIVDVPERELGYDGVRTSNVYVLYYEVKYESINDKPYKHICVSPWNGDRKFVAYRQILRKRLYVFGVEIK